MDDDINRCGCGAPAVVCDCENDDRLACPQCGEPTEELHEGYCRECCDDNQYSLDAHNAGFDRWERMSDRERGDEIRRATHPAQGER